MLTITSPVDIPATAAEDTTAKATQDLTAKWRNYLNSQMNLDPRTFQLAQGSLGLQTSDNYGLYVMSDAVPPSSAVGYYDATSMKRRTSAYSMLLGALLPEVGSDALRTALGNYYTQWITWSQANKAGTGDTTSSRLDQWGLDDAVDPGTLARGHSAILAANNSQLVSAQTEMWTNAGKYQQTFVLPGQRTPTTLYVYTDTVDIATRAISNGATLDVTFDSKEGTSDVSETFVEGSASGFYDIFSSHASGSFETLNSRAASSAFTISGRIGKYATVPVSAGGWYDSAEVSRAFNGENDYTIWDAASASGTYESYFGLDGGLARYVSQLVLVSDYSLTVTSEATYNEQDLEDIKANASVGVWPFFAASGSATHTTDHRLNSKSQLETTYTLAKGLIEIWGVSIQAQN